MKLDVTFYEINARTIDIKFQSDEKSFGGDFGQIQYVTEFIGGEPFTGDYTVVPKVDSQTMATKGKVMTEDVVITEIPFFDVTNTSGGSTVYIAKEI